MIHRGQLTFPISSVMRSLLLTALTLLLTFCALPLSSYAQSATATLSGTVEDQNKGLVPGAKVKVINLGTGLERDAVTNDSGGFSVPLLPPSTYTIRVERDGFVTIEISNVVLNVGDAKSLLIQMKVGDVKEVVNVTGQEPLINDSPAVGTVVDHRFVENMPLNGRSFQNLIALTPGVVVTPTNFNEQGQFSVNGQRQNANYFMVDGVSANIGISAGNGLVQSAGGALPGLGVLGGTNGLVSVDAMQEFRIQTSTFAPEFGRTPGAQVSIVTRSGANQFHGSAFDYLRNDVLDARDWFVNRNGLPKPKDRQNDFGGVFNGPILKNRTFFFLSYEGLRLRQPLSATTTVPSTATRQTAQSTTPQILSYLNAFPIPNGPVLTNGFAQFSASYSNPSSLDAYSIRVDHTINSKLSLFGRYNNSPSSTVVRSATVLSTIQPTEINIQTLTLGTTQTISSRLTNEARVNYSRETGGSLAINDSFGGATPLTDGQVFPSGFSSANSLFQFGITGAGTLALGKNTNNLQRQWNIVDNLSLLLRSHQLKFGVDYRRLSPSAGPRAYTQTANFSGITGANGVLAAVTSSATIASLQSVNLRVQNFSLFGQDTWKVTPRLSITYGLRWDVNPAISGSDPNSEPFTVLGLDNPATMTLAPRGTSLYSTTYGNVAPRIGISYQARNTTGWETVLRGGIGVFYDLGAGYLGQLTTGFPFTASKSLGHVPFPFASQQAAPPVISLTPPVTTNLYVTEPNLSLPRSYQWNIAAEQSLGKRQALTATYVGAIGRDLLRQDTLSSPNPNFSFVIVTRNTATSDYHALQLEFQRRLSQGLQALASYTWSHSIDIASNDSVTINTPATITAALTDRGDSDFDVRHSFSAALSYDIPAPWKDGVARRLLGGWSIDNYITARTALPVNLIAATVVFGGTFFTPRPNLIAGVPLYLFGPQYPGGKILNNTVFTAGQIAAAGCLASGAAKGPFCTPPTGTQGNLGRNVLRGFGAWQDDFSLRRQFSITERIKFQLRAEFFNVFNHPNFANPVNNLASSLFGQSTQTLASGLGSGGANGGFNPLYQLGGPRSIQIAAKIQF